MLHFDEFLKNKNERDSFQDREKVLLRIGRSRELVDLENWLHWDQELVALRELVALVSKVGCIERIGCIGRIGELVLLGEFVV